MGILILNTMIVHVFTAQAAIELIVFDMLHKMHYAQRFEPQPIYLGGAHGF
jgi:hypothetical protein